MKYLLLVEARDLEGISAFDERLIRAGVLIAGGRLEANAGAANVAYSGQTRAVVDGAGRPDLATATGFWILQVSSRDEAIEWARRAPLVDGQVKVQRVLDPDGLERRHEPNAVLPLDEWPAG